MKLMHVAVYSLFISLVAVFCGFGWVATSYSNFVELPRSHDVLKIDQIKDIPYKHFESSNDVSTDMYPCELAVPDDVNDSGIESNSSDSDIEYSTEAVIEEEMYIEPTTYMNSYDDSNSDQPFDWSSYSSYHPTSGLTPQGGINFYDNGSGERLETAYSSNVLYHYRTGEWTVDSEGFYHDSDGRYVVAASDLEQGTIFETSKGEAIVLDSGCNPGVTDFYVNW